MSPTFTLPLTPKYPRINAGLKNTPTKFPNAELKTAAASSPPAALVMTRTMLMVMGNEAAMVIPLARFSSSTLPKMSSLDRPNTMDDTTPKLKTWTKTLNLTFSSALENSDVFRLRPASKKMKITAIQEAVMSGAT